MMGENFYAEKWSTTFESIWSEEGRCVVFGCSSIHVHIPSMLKTFVVLIMFPIFRKDERWLIDASAAPAITCFSFFLFCQSLLLGIGIRLQRYRCCCTYMGTRCNKIPSVEWIKPIFSGTVFKNTVRWHLQGMALQTKQYFRHNKSTGGLILWLKALQTVYNTKRVHWYLFGPC